MEEAREHSMNEVAQEAAEKQFTLSEILGGDWKQRAIFPEIKAAFSEEGIQDFSELQEVLPLHANSEIERYIALANAIFHYNGRNYIAYKFTAPNGKEKALIVGKIGEDFICYTTRRFLILSDQKGKEVICWDPDTITLIGKRGVLRLDKLLPKEYSTTIVVVEKKGGGFEVNMQATTGSTDLDLVFQTPHTYSGIGALMHELGHLLNESIIMKSPDLYKVFYTANVEFKKTSQTGRPSIRCTLLSPYYIRKLKSILERRAWAIGISILREAGRLIGLDCATPNALRRIMELAKKALETYDEVPYTLIGHPDDKPIPAFSSPRRKAARQLHREVQLGVGSYTLLPSFDSITGKPIANNPQNLRKIISESIQRKK